MAQKKGGGASRVWDTLGRSCCLSCCREEADGRGGLGTDVAAGGRRGLEGPPRRLERMLGKEALSEGTCADRRGWGPLAPLAPMEGGRPGRAHTVCVILKVMLAALGGRRASLPLKATPTAWPAVRVWGPPLQLSSGNVAPPVWEWSHDSGSGSLIA